MLENFTLTQTLAILLGIYMLSAGIGLLTDSKGFAGIMDAFLNNLAVTYIAAILAFSVGGTIIALHNLWSTPLEIIVSAIGWAALIEGVLMLAFRRPFFTLVGAMPMHESFMKAYGVFTLAIGSVLLILALNG